MKNPVATTQSTNALGPQKTNHMPTTFTEETPEILRSDIIVPYVVVMQGLSEFVKLRKAQMGDICRSTNAEKLGDPEKGINAIFLHYPSSDWVLEQKKDGKFEYRKTMPRNAANEDLPWSYWSTTGFDEVPPGTTGASEWRRVKRLSVFALLQSDIEAEKIEKAKAKAGELPDPSKALTPVIISFRSMSYNAGKEITTFYTKAKSMGAPIWRYMLPLGAALEQNDKGSFYVWKPDQTKAKGIAKEDIPLVETWVKIVGSGRGIQVDESGETMGEARTVDSTSIV